MNKSSLHQLESRWNISVLENVQLGHLTPSDWSPLKNDII